MPIIAKEPQQNFPQAPEGPQQAVCVDVVDLGIVEQTFGEETTEKPMVRVVWHSAEKDETGKPYTIAKRYTLSLHEKATLRKDLEAWRGKAFTDDELNGFDLEKLIGVNAFLSITHRLSQKGKSFANVTSIMRLPNGMSPMPVTPGYIRQCDREPEPPMHHHDAGTPPDDDDDSRIPF